MTNEHYQCSTSWGSWKFEVKQSISIKFCQKTESMTTSVAVEVVEDLELLNIAIFFINRYVPSVEQHWEC